MLPTLYHGHKIVERPTQGMAKSSRLCYIVRMKRTATKESGSAFIVMILAAAVIAVAGFASYRYYQATKSNPSSSSSPKIKSLAINLDYYDASTNKAGDVEFRKWDFTTGGLDAIFSEYGRAAAANNGQGAGRLNPQPTFLAPVGTKVHSLVDGVVVNVPMNDRPMISQSGQGFVIMC